MIDNCYIDNISTANKYGVWVLKGGYTDLLSFPALRDPETNDWPEEDGIEVDLASPRLEEKEVTIPFFAKTETGMWDFIAMLTAPGNRSLRIPVLNRSWSLHMLDHTANNVHGNSVAFSIKFQEDKPVRPISGIYSPGCYIADTCYKLDDVSLSSFGITVLEGKEQAIKSSAAKIGLNRKVSTSDGQIFDVDTLMFKHKEVTFKCLLKAVSMTNFWDCYDNFFAALIAPSERQLYVPALQGAIPCYYKKMSNAKFYGVKGPVMMTFDLTVVVTVFRIKETEYFLVSEDGDLITTEDGEYLIDME